MEGWGGLGFTTRMRRAAGGGGFRGACDVLALFFLPYLYTFRQESANFLFGIARDAYARIVG